MLGTVLDGDALRRSQASTLSSPEHRTNPHHRDQKPPTSRRREEYTGEDTTSTLDSASSTRTSDPTIHDGTWGEHDAERLNAEDARLEYEQLRKNLHQMHRAQTTDSQVNRTALNRLSMVASRPTQRLSATDPESGSAEDEQANAPANPWDTEEFDLEKFMREGHFEKTDEEEGGMKRVGVVYENLTVRGIATGAQFVKTVPQAVIGTFGPDLYHLLCRFMPFLRFRQPQTRELLHDFTGVVRNGEMMLVLGRPGAGCSTFLKTITNKRDSYASVEGEVTYGGISAERQRKSFRGEVTYNEEDDIHFPTLSVWQTLTFALMNKSKKSVRQDIPVIADALLRMFGISHTKYTKIGDDFIRGVSGGERKRVSIAETLASKASVIAWDNSTRGLDASTALDYARSLRIMTDVSNRTTLVTLYQAGEGIYEVMDKVLVIDQGRQIFSGPANKAKQYFIDLGFECPPRQTTADFLTAVTDPNERRIRPGFEKSIPRTPEALEKAFRDSPTYQELLDDVASYKEFLKETNYQDTKRFEGAVQESKSKHVSEKSPYTIPFHHQVWACTKREAWLLLTDTKTLWTKLFITVSCALIFGSLFNGSSTATDGVFSRGGAVYVSIIFLAWLQMSELMKAVSGRDVVHRHKEYAFYRPSAVSMARSLLDFPAVAVQCVLFGTIMYFMTDLDLKVEKFWINILFVYSTAMVITSLYRMFAALSPNVDTAIRFSGVGLNILIIFTGYPIPKPQLLNEFLYFGWLSWINPLGYAFEGVLSNELTGKIMDCAPSQLVPQGPGINPAFQGCALTGAAINAANVSGDDYLQTTFNYSRANLWRNFAVLVGFAILYLLITMIAVESFTFVSSGGGSLVFKKSKKIQQKIQQITAPVDEESGPATGSASSVLTLVQSETGMGGKDVDDMEQLTESSSVFTWRDLEYTVPYRGSERRLLNKVNGYIKPGTMMALVGASGAGKTTLLNTLSQRQKIGVIKGDMLVDGKALGSDFQRNTGFCLQGDIHDGTQTVREAIEFSALLRQEASVPYAEKIAYVNKVVNLLELEELEDVIISSLGVEQRKRVTIAVELAAKPSLLLFLDEPTSGLDAQSAYSIVSFLKKLSRAGQSIMCTIHQPSSVLIEQFDAVLALNRGGNVFYFGPIGENGKEVIKYFGDRGAECPEGKNIAEFILETAARPHRRPDGTRTNWNKEWAASPEAKRVIEEIEDIREKASKEQAPKDSETAKKFATSTWVQTMELTKRMFRQHWREPSYVYGKLFVSFIFGIFNGFSYYQMGDTMQDMQNRMFTIFLIVCVPPTTMNAVLPKFWDNNEIWEAREHPSRIYGWVAFCTASIVVEIPAAIFAATLYWAVWCWPTGLAGVGLTGGYTFLMVVLMFCFMSGWAQWICAFAPSYTIISNVLPFFFVMTGGFNGVVQPYHTMNVFWKSWMYWVNPMTYWINGMMAATMDGLPINCTPDETAKFDTPFGETCQEYAGSFAESAGGYLLNPEATSGCEYCLYQNANQYLETLNVSAENKWRDLGIFTIFVFSNWALVYFFVYTVRVRGWSFGLATVFGGLHKGVKKVKSFITGREQDESYAGSFLS